MITDASLAARPLTAKAWDFLAKRYVVFQKTLQYLRANFDEAYLDFSEGLMRIVNARPGGLEGALTAFIRYSNEYLILQARLNKEGRYLNSSYEEVNRSVYQGEVMNKYYLDGLFLSQALWPNHYKMGQYFLECRGCSGPQSRVMDVPTGPGFYSLLFARHFQFDRLDSFDISASAIEYTRHILSFEKPAGKVELRVANILEGEASPVYDFICCGELLEHLERPRELLARLKALLKPGRTLFLTTAIYAAAIDHIFLMRNAGETRALLREFFTIQSELILPVTLEEFREDMDRVPINYACVLK